MTSAPFIEIHTRADSLVAAFARAGYSRVSPAILQPAEPFLDLSGEDMRRRMFLVTDAAGRELCLRPDLTIPVARDYLASAAAAQPAGFCYLGPVFRDRGAASGEFLQAGIESFGRADKAAADAEALALGIAATAHYGLAAPRIVMGDVALFAALIAALDLAPAWKRRLLKDFNRKATLAQDLERLTLASGQKRSEYQGVLAALANANPKAAQLLVTDLLSIAGKSAVGGRSIGEIADRFVEQAELGASNALPSETRALIARFLAIADTPSDAAAALRALAAEARISLGPALDLFENRIGLLINLLAARGVDVDRIQFATAFGRGVDYYSGFVFELHDPDGRVDGQLVAGGRYDVLLSRLGSPLPVAAVGFAAWIERLEALSTHSGEKP
ncbi:MAG TPA: ATP phosphoribosyltransferase regulatory subunit [Xanthobacteraceae bacterium]|jgi:ATP phosphoribosyltransferase regulatory subunit|nr:ATP phosphoribosyltransferase regulatory subunit [Xanthobacteraceae bacterium]